MSNQFKDAMLRAAMVAVTPQTRDELYMISDALRIWKEHPELRNEVVTKTGVTPDAMLSRCVMVIALVKFGVDPIPEMPEDYKAPSAKGRLMGEQLDIFGDDGKRGSGQSAPHPQGTQQGATTPGQGASLAAGNVAESHCAPADHRSADPSSPTRPSIDQRWADFHAANPHVFDEILRMAKERVGRGDTYLSVKDLWESARRGVASDGVEYKLDNSFTSIVGRLLVQQEPRLAGVIHTRKRKDER